MTTFERTVLDAFLVGDELRLALLRAQAQVCTSAGTYTLIPVATRDPDTLALQLAGHKSTTR